MTQQSKKPIYVIRDREAGNYITSFNSLDAAEKTVNLYEEEDREEGNFTPEFYEITKV